MNRIKHYALNFFGYLKYVANYSSENNIDGDKLILFKSSNYLIINKPCDILINSTEKDKDTVHRQILKLYPSLQNDKLIFDVWFVHRLDFSTSGVMCIALNKEACCQASTAFKERKVKKYYLGIVRGHIAEDTLYMNYAIAEQQGGDKHLMCTSDLSDQNCKDALTLAVVLCRGLFDNKPATKLLLQPITGRRHQLRVHCAKIGHPIVGDYSYSNRKDTDPPRMFLHSFRLILPTRIESVDISTVDPFDSQYDWRPIELVCELNEAFDKIERIIKSISYNVLFIKYCTSNLYVYINYFL